jgi:hypothetical protein
MFKSYQKQLQSTRFLFVQELILIAIASAIMKTFFSEFPMTELLAFLTPLVAIVYGLKSQEHIKNSSKSKIEKENFRDVDHS